MNYVTANELKRNGLSVVREAVEKYGAAGITVRGKNAFVVLSLETYNHLRECELQAALAEVREDIEAGRGHTDGVEKHIARITGP